MHICIQQKLTWINVKKEYIIFKADFKKTQRTFMLEI